MTDFPFFAQPDSTSCYQACLKIILVYLKPEKEYSWNELYKFCDKKPDKWTWPMRGMVNLKKLDLGVIDIEEFDYTKLIKNPFGYLESIFGSEVAKIQIEKSDIDSEIQNAKDLLENIDFKMRIPQKNDLLNLLNDKYVLILNVNSQVLQDKNGYAGHFIILKYIDSEKVIINDPGGDSGENNEYSLKKFLKAWSYPDEKARNVMGVKLIK